MPSEVVEWLEVPPAPGPKAAMWSEPSRAMLSGPSRAMLSGPSRAMPLRPTWAMRLGSFVFSAWQLALSRPYDWAKGVAHSREVILVAYRPPRGYGNDASLFSVDSIFSASGGLGEVAYPPGQIVDPLQFARDAAFVMGFLRGVETVPPAQLIPALGGLLLQSDQVSPVQRRIRCGVVGALLSFAAVQRGTPVAGILSRHFGTTVLKDIPVNGLVATKNLEAACADASSLMEQGFSTLKVKLHGVVSQDRALLRAVREAAPDAALRIDPNQSWPEAQALPILESISELGVEYVEDPLPTHASIEDYAELCNRSPVAIALDAPVESLEMVDRIIEARAADILVLKPQRLGGLDVVMLAAQRGKEAGIRVTLTGSLESSVGTCANFQLAAALPEPRFACGLGTSMFFKEDFAPMPPARAGVYRLSDLPTRFLGA